MIDIESELSHDLHAHLDTLTAPPDLARAARARVAHVRRARVATGAAAAVAVTAVAMAIYAVPHFRSDARTDQLAGGGAPAATPLVARTHAYVNALARGDFAAIRERMTPAARALLTEDELRTLWRSVDTALGGFRSVGSTREEPLSLGSRVTADVVFANSTAYLRVDYTPRGDVAAFVLTTDPGNVSIDAARTDLGRHARTLVTHLAARDYAFVRRDFDPTMRRELTVAKLRAGWDEVVRTQGRFVRLDGQTERDVAGFHVVRVLCVFAHGLVEARVSYDGRARVAGLYLLPVMG